MLQKHKPTAFHGQKFTEAQRNWIAYEKEFYEMVQTFKKNRLSTIGSLADGCVYEG